jgi:D-serine deaminase-like pyridoxal phosphate-dependent protein
MAVMQAVADAATQHPRLAKERPKILLQIGTTLATAGVHDIESQRRLSAVLQHAQLLEAKHGRQRGSLYKVHDFALLCVMCFA